VAGPRVVSLYEDKTGGGLHRLVSTMVMTKRAEAGREPLAYFRDLAMKSNTKLIAECSNFERMRFFGPHHADHVMAVIDAYEVEKVVRAAPGPLGPPLRDDPNAFAAYCQTLDETVRDHMRKLAFASMTPVIRHREEERFHPFVLFWERESVFLAGSEILRETRKLEFPEEKTTPNGIQTTRCPTSLVEAAWLAKSGLKYSKQINGPQLFGDLARDYSRWPVLLERLPCLEVIIRTLVAL
jgi:hypothetical protein